VNNAQDGPELADQLGYPVVIRPSFTLGNCGSIATIARISEAIAHALDSSPVQSRWLKNLCWDGKEFELEVMRRLSRQLRVICSIENFDPMAATAIPSP